jgi:Nif-specific regulatory protein
MNESGETSQWLDTLVEVVQLVNSSLDFEEVLRLTLEGSMRVTNAEAGALILLDELEDELIIKVAAGPKAQEAQDMRFPKGQGIAGWVAEKGEPRIVSDVEQDRHFFRNIDQTTGFKTQSILAAPLRVKQELIGVLEVINKRQGGNFGEADLKPITTFADLAAIAIDNAGAYTELRLENRRLRARLDLEGAIFGRSPAMWEVVQQIERVARRPVTVLVRGETGTGKGVIAREIHQRSPRRDQAFVEVDCGAISQGLWESELFGHKRGSFTGATQDKEGLFEAADGGTIFLDEIGNTPLELQARLLHVLQEGEIRRVGETRVRKVDVRLLAATNRDLEKAVQEEGFREDLFFRLNVFPVFLPPLRERTEEVPSLLDYFIDKFNQELSGNVDGVSPEALQLLMAYPWPGNIRELENFAKRLIVMVDEGDIGLEHLPPEIQRGTGQDSGTGGKSSSSAGSAPQTLADMEQEQINRALEDAQGNQSQAARLLGISREQLRYRMRKYGIDAGRGSA